MLLLPGCGWGAVDVAPYEPAPGTATVCRTLVGGLPRTLGDAVRRDVDSSVRTTAAAWGDPAIVLRCGVDLPPEYRPDAEAYEVDGVAWFPVAGEGGTFFTTTGRVATVELAVPDDYAPESGVLTELAQAVAAAVPESAG